MQFSRQYSLHLRALLALMACLLVACNLAAVPTPTEAPQRAPPPTFTHVFVPTPTLTPVAAPNVILFLGDSIVEGWRTYEIYPASLNGARWGNTSAQTLRRFQERFAGFYYDAAVVLVGINDITSGVPDATLQSNIAALTDLLQRSAGRVVLGSLLPVGTGRYSAQVDQRISEMNRWIQDYAISRGFIYADFYTPMSDGQGHAYEPYFLDGLHPTRDGYGVMATVLATALQ